MRRDLLEASGMEVTLNHEFCCLKVSRGQTTSQNNSGHHPQIEWYVTTCMHACILAMCAGTPTLGVVYEFKMEELFKNSGMPDVVLSTNTLSEDSIQLALRELLDNREKYQSHISGVVDLLNMQAWSAVDALLGLGPR